MTKIIVEIDNAEKAAKKRVKEHKILKELIVKRKNPAILKYL